MTCSSIAGSLFLVGSSSRALEVRGGLGRLRRFLGSLGGKLDSATEYHGNLYHQYLITFIKIRDVYHLLEGNMACSGVGAGCVLVEVVLEVVMVDFELLKREFGATDSGAEGERAFAVVWKDLEVGCTGYMAAYASPKGCV